MFHEITTAIAKAISQHPESALSGLFGISGTIFGTLLGLGGGHVLERWRRAGKVVITPVEMDWVPDSENSNGGGLIGVKCDMDFRILNTFPIAKTFELQDIGYFQKRLKLRSGKSLLDTRYLQIRCDEPGVRIFQVAANSFIRLGLFGVSFPAGGIQQLGDKWNWLRVRFLVSPNRTVVVWHRLRDKKTARPTVTSSAPMK
jgi:hypothetical protein